MCPLTHTIHPIFSHLSHSSLLHRHLPHCPQSQNPQKPTKLSTQFHRPTTQKPEGRDSRLKPSDWLNNFHRDLMTEAVMGGVVHTIVAPIERTKLLMQSQESSSATLGGVGTTTRFKGMLDCIATKIEVPKNEEWGHGGNWHGHGRREPP